MVYGTKWVKGKRWQRKPDLFNGIYLFHVHTNYTDGTLSVEDVFRWAARHNVTQVIFLEHIRRKPSYDVVKFIDEVNEMSQKYDLTSTVGFEVPIRAGGRLDISDKHIGYADVIGIAEHKRPANDLRRIMDNLANAFEEAVQYDKPIVWVHPGRWLYSMNCPMRMDVMIAQAVQKGIRLEMSPNDIVKDFELDWKGLVLGADAHNFNDLGKWNTFVVDSLQGIGWVRAVTLWK